MKNSKQANQKQNEKKHMQNAAKRKANSTLETGVSVYSSHRDTSTSVFDDSSKPDRENDLAEGSKPTC
eukprot:1978660-Amphidinium_carterae.1